MQTLAVAQAFESFTGNFPHTPFINITHRVYSNAALTQIITLFCIKVANTDHDNIFRQEARARPTDIDKIRVTMTEQ